MSLFGRLIKHDLLFVTRMVVGFQIYFNSLNNSARLNYAGKICLIMEVMFRTNCFFHFCQQKSDYPEKLNICTKGTKSVTLV